MTIDITYIQSGIFTAFIPESKAGEQAFNQMAEFTGGTGKVLCTQEKAVIAQLRAAGYSVRKAKPMSVREINEIYAELDI